MFYKIEKYRNMGLMKRAKGALMFDRTLASYSPTERKAIRSLKLGNTEEVFGQSIPKNTGPIALLLLYYEGDSPKEKGHNYLVLDSTTGRTYFAVFDGKNVIVNGQSRTLIHFNLPSFRWFRLPEITSECLDAF